jgi:Rrf2 family protein
MRLTTKSEYSLLAMIFIARNSDKSFIKTDDICQEYKISKKYLEHLLVVLKNNRLLKTKRGAKGGYALTRPAEQISLAEIIRLMDGALAPTVSVSKYFYCSTPLEKEKKILVAFKDIRDYIAQKMEKTTLKDLI